MDESITSQDLVSWLVLMRSPGLSPVVFNKLLPEFGTTDQLIKADPGRLLQAGLNSRTIEYFRKPDWKIIEDDITWLDKPGNDFVSCTDDQYPDLLRNIPDPPMGLFISGKTELLNYPQIAIIGTRKSTPGGRRIATDFAGKLASYGFTITSGLANGIDTAAHHGALISNRPTIAVMGNGLDMVYPRNNRKLAEKIVEIGALVSEFPTGTRPLPVNFPRRNRIISGMSVGTLVVEAAIKSGSLITARLAMEQGREVFAVPGSIFNPVSSGCHLLISDGAKLTTNTDDILEEIGPLCSVVRKCEQGYRKRGRLNETLDEEHKLLLDNIGYDPVNIDQLVNATGLPVHEISVLLLDLELSGLIDSMPGARFTRR